jgi:hypothetical protein
MVWSLALEGREDIERFKELGWGLRTWANWEWNDCDKRFGDDWPGRHRSRPKKGEVVIFVCFASFAEVFYVTFREQGQEEARKRF